MREKAVLTSSHPFIFLNIEVCATDRMPYDPESISSQQLQPLKKSKHAIKLNSIKENQTGSV